jgi:hypothetical protein
MFITDGTRTAAATEEPYAELETPFLPSLAETAAPPPAQSWEIETPFLSEYRSGEQIVDARAGAIRELLQDLLDPEFEEELEDLIARAEDQTERMGLGETATDTAKAERLLERWIEPIRTEAEAMLDRMATALEGQELATLGETELEEILDRFEPQETDYAPTFEGFGFLKKLHRKVKKAVSGAVALAKKGVAAVSKVLPLGPILNKLKALVRPLLRKVIAVALNKIPPELRPYIKQLAGKFLGEEETPEGLEEESESAAASVDSRQLQLAFDGEIANLLMAPSEEEAEDVLAEAYAAAAPVEGTDLGELDDARQRFISEIEHLAQGQDPTPLVENFLPAVIPALKVGIGIVGRPKVVSFLAGYLGRLIAPYVGPKITPVLSRAIVDAGLKLISLETPQDGERRIGAEAFANIVEDTMRHVGQQPEADLEDDRLLEAAAYEGFQQAVAENLPTTLLDPASEYLETSRPLGTWIGMPRGQRVRYRKYSRIFPVAVTPAVARAVRTFGGGALDRYLRDRLGQTGIVRGRVHLYQAVPGTRPGRIAAGERAVRGLGRAVAGRGNLHPLTKEAAGILLAEPGLGREFEESRLERDTSIAVGDRLFFLEVPGVKPMERRSSGASIFLDRQSNEARIAIFVSESDAQAIATRLRKREPIGASLASLRRIFTPAIRAALKGRTSAARVRGESLEPEEFIGKLVRPAATIRRIVVAALVRWTSSALGAELAKDAKRFIDTTEQDADGLTLTVKMTHPALSTAGQLISGRPGALLKTVRSAAGLQRTFAGAPQATVDIQPGFHRAE